MTRVSFEVRGSLLEIRKGFLREAIESLLFGAVPLGKASVVCLRKYGTIAIPNPMVRRRMSW